MCRTIKLINKIYSLESSNRTASSWNSFYPAVNKTYKLGLYDGVKIRFEILKL